jgi:beta-N-acetylhexosaminidase
MKKAKNSFIKILVSVLLIILFSIITISSIQINKYSKHEIVSIKVKFGQMMMFGFQGQEVSPKISRKIELGHIGGLILFNRNINSKNDVIKLTNSIRGIKTLYPVLIAVDQEGGYVSRLNLLNGFKAYPSAKYIGRKKTLEEAKKVYSGMASMLRRTGFNTNFAPVVDIDVNSDSPAIGRLRRCFSSDPQKVAEYSEVFIEAHRAARVITVLKHFPGHGSAYTDSHYRRADITKTWQEKELVPYEYLINKDLVDMIMVAHVTNTNFDKKYPASLSKKIINDLLRNKLGFTNVVVTDDLMMKAVVKYFGFENAILQAIEAGNDILLFADVKKEQRDISNKVMNIFLKAYAEGKISKQRINESFARIVRLKRKTIY